MTSVTIFQDLKPCSRAQFAPVTKCAHEHGFTEVYFAGIKSAIEGIKATAVVLRGSTEIVSVTPSTRKYVKQGTYKTAVTDFFSVHPTNVRDYKRSGEVGVI